MQCKEILKHVASLLNLKSIESELSAELFLNVSSDLKMLLNALNIALYQVREEFIPAVNEESFSVDDNGVLPFYNLKYSPLKIISLKDEYGYNIAYTKVDGGIKPKRNTGTLTYSYKTEAVYFEDEVDLDLLPLRVLSYGIIGEYYILSNRYEEGAMYNDRFNNGLQGLAYPASKKTLPFGRLF